MGQGRVASPVTATTDFLAPGILDKAVARSRHKVAPSTGPCDRCGGSEEPGEKA